MTAFYSIHFQDCDNVWMYLHDAGKPVDVSREQERVESFSNDSHENHISAIMENLDEFLDDCREMGFDGLL